MLQRISDRLCLIETLKPKFEKPAVNKFAPRVSDNILNGIVHIKEIDKQILLSATDIKSLINLYLTCHYFAYILEEKPSLDKLCLLISKKTKVSTFKEFVDNYDIKRATIRSCKYHDAQTCVYMAAQNGDEKMLYYYIPMTKVDDVFTKDHNNEIATRIAKSGNIQMLDNFVTFVSKTISTHKNACDNVSSEEKEINWSVILQGAINSENKKMFDYVYKKCGPDFAQTVKRLHLLSYNKQYELIPVTLGEVICDISNIVFLRYIMGIFPDLVNCKPQIAASKSNWYVMEKILSKQNWHNVALTSPSNIFHITGDIINSKEPDYILKFIKNHLVPNFTAHTREYKICILKAIFLSVKVASSSLCINLIETYHEFLMKFPLHMCRLLCFAADRGYIDVVNTIIHRFAPLKYTL
jgi:hypothetical protein